MYESEYVDIEVGGTNIDAPDAAPPGEPVDGPCSSGKAYVPLSAMSKHLEPVIGYYWWR